MSKRLASNDAAPKQRKRKRKVNGISRSSEILDTPPEILRAPQSRPDFMRVWRTNAETPAVVQKSSTPIPNLLAEQVVRFREGSNAVGTPLAPVELPAAVDTSPETALPKRKTRNNSVSSFFTPHSSESLIPSNIPDENENLRYPPNNNIG